jgi:hypothetical protein
MTDLATRIIEAARAAWANDYFDSVEPDRDVVAQYPTGACDRFGGDRC